MPSRPTTSSSTKVHAGSDAASSSFLLDPRASAFNALGQGQTSLVTVSYSVSDGTATTPACAADITA